ncbi:head maturation protease, ClpP-related [Clostridium cellulovorans]|jgi:ATP-dependent Clp protease protease subunit|uniref:ATP-dependent Clp protease proteolytic subunit n=1 Tax=Clostridium cellulovorans (strain ATCC 35296 / DSM 3052 / OCM 3 / 743B) TaxID=573061 RepID=D9SLK2_CLOC7|nr:head maturation protease, ClpP-related [Clostridium cellulovorans]ADL53639.1 peptidase S14 ClpP [Clostridium cellulovorans 743B]MDD2978798.1 Clp protease ClpP [Hespellia sp.]
MKKFWNWKNQAQTENSPAERTLFLNGTIAEESWFDDDVTPQLFKDELNAGEGDITVWINSPGGDCVAAAQIYNMLSNYKGKVTVKIDGIAASAASVIAMAGKEVLMSPVSMLMIHNPMTIAMGDHAEMQKAIDMLAEVKESIINAYVLKTGLSRAKLSHLMDSETWMNANKAVELGFADGTLTRDNGGAENSNMEDAVEAVMFSSRAVNNALQNKISAKYGKQKQTVVQQSEIPAPETNERNVDALLERLDIIKNHI